VSSDERLIAGCWGVPIAWDGTVADLPDGFTDSLARAVTSYEEGVVPNTFVLMAAAVRSDEPDGHPGSRRNRHPDVEAALASGSRRRRRRRVLPHLP